MPTYVYACKACDHRFEQYQSFSEDSLTVCPECEGSLRKVFNSVGVVFKGSGFYRNDARGSKSSGSLLAASDSEKASATSSADSSATSSADSGAAASSAAPAAPKVSTSTTAPAQASPQAAA
ncbi:FmdB family transcriptional regulator [Micrococcales bacterium 31B]|nr:FmdB family transcriptional regulator [Micrococcales bacterium 31B]